MEAAKAHFAAGSAYYDQANYADAVKEFNEAFRLSKRTDLLYNIAVCYERLNDLDNAIATLKRYLTERPDAPDRVTIQSRVANLEKRKSQPPTVPVTPPPEVAPTPPPPAIVAPPPVEPVQRRGGAKWYVPGAVLLVSGLGVGIASLGTGLAAHGIYNDLKVACPTMMNCDPSLRADHDRGVALGLSSDVLMGVGIAAGVTGVILLIVQSRPVKR